MTPEKVRFFLPRSRRHRPISLRNSDMLSTLALAVLTWGKKAPEPEPEPASTLGMTLLAVGVCWVPPSVDTCGLCTASTRSPSAPRRSGSAGAGRSPGRALALGSLRGASSPNAQLPWCPSRPLPLWARPAALHAPALRCGPQHGHGSAALTPNHPHRPSTSCHAVRPSPESNLLPPDPHRCCR